MKVLFLDIDGVLNSALWYGKRSSLLPPPRRTIEHLIYEIDPDALARLKRIVEQTGCELVISSTLRRVYRIIQFREAFAHLGWSGVNFAGATPVLPQGRRGEEVRAWLNTVGKIMEVKRHCCVDDDSQDFYIDSNLFQTYHAYGLTDEVADSIVKFLNANDNSGEEAV